MEKCSIIIQGEGKGHFSQALAVMKMLEDQDYEVKRVYLSRSFFRPTPAYFYADCEAPLVTYYSPNFIRSSDQKGIRVLLSILINLLLSPIYIFETIRIGVLMANDRSKSIYIFYDPVGAISARIFRNRAKRTIMSHHFYLMHPDFMHPHGMGRAMFWLNLMNRIMYRSANTVQALSFRKGKDAGKIRIVPPVISAMIREENYQPGKRDLCYFLNHGFANEMIEFYRGHPELSADIFTDAKPSSDIPENVKLHPPSRKKFLEAMLQCKRIISTAGFDLVAEAFYLGIPIFLIPSANHYEQYCNALDASRTGMAFQLEAISDLEEIEFEPKSNKQYRGWVERHIHITLARNT